MDDLKIIFIFNTIKSYPEGLTYYDLKKYGSIPHSKVYRMMKILEENGDLIRKNDISQETGRPKHLYYLSKQGEKKLDELCKKIGSIFEFIIQRFPETAPDFDHKTFLSEATFNVWSSPVEFIMQKEISEEEKLRALSEIEYDVIKLLEQIKNEKNKLEKKFQKEMGISKDEE